MHTIASLIDRKNTEGSEVIAKSFPHITSIAKNGATTSGAWKTFLTGLAEWIVRVHDIAETLNNVGLHTQDIAALQDMNAYLYADQHNYDTSFANPAYAVQQLGEGYGQAAAACRTYFRGYFRAALDKKAYKIAEYQQLFLDIHALFEKGIPSQNDFTALVNRPNFEVSAEKTAIALYERFSKENDAFKKRIETCDLSTDHYLYAYGEYISKHEHAVTAFLRTYSDEKIEKLASTIVNAYIRGFELSRKDYTKKKTVLLYTFAGYEKLTRRIIVLFREKGLEPLVNEVISSACNRQYPYDHRFDEALYLTKDYADRRIATYEQAMEMCKDILAEYSGGTYIETFGEEPFAPVSKKENIVLTKEQQALRQRINSKMGEIREKFMPRKEGSFNITAFPSPEIGDRFEEIFADTCEINMLDTIKYEAIQQCIVDELDKAVSVEIRGVAGNKTNLSVAMQPLTDPVKHTNFVNCGADVNVPVGEVFTSPQLKGTNGMLHVPETFLDGLKYTDLEITFTDGFVSDYSCKNFSNEAENKKYIEENLLFPHKTLPLGEFAIGTNTLAYVVAKKYGIIEKMPVLIVEKMGPHFAIGDTCFSHEEDFAVYNPIDGKEITARDNEKSLLRKTDMSQAYTFNHTDITLPYEGIGNITSIHTDGTRVDIIKDGRFVLKGTEELNKPLDTM